MLRLQAKVTLFPLLVGIVSCGTTVEYTETNAPPKVMTSRSPDQVEVFETRPPADRTYQEVGHIEARQSSSYSLHGQSGIIRELRTQAAEMGCEGIIITGSANTVSGSVSAGSGSVSTLKGYSAICIMFTGAKAPTENAPAAAITASSQERGEAPDGVAGFKFTMTAEDAQSTCEGAGHGWSSSARGGACSGTPSPVGFSAAVQLLGCGPEYCQILVKGEAEEAKILGTVTGLRDAISRRYGKPQVSTTAFPQRCQSTPTECIEEQRAYFEYVWTFENGQSIKLRLGEKPASEEEASGTDHLLRLLYTRREPLTEGGEDQLAL